MLFGPEKMVWLALSLLINEHFNDLRQSVLWFPTEFCARLRGITNAFFDVRGPKQRGIAIDMFRGIESKFRKHHANEIPERVLFTGGNHLIVGFILLQHHPHCFDIIGCPAPIARDSDIVSIRRSFEPLAILTAVDTILRVTKRSDRRADS